jgi:NAD(P)H-dependent FMN reductase/ketosteroid isomerase-like protein
MNGPFSVAILVGSLRRESLSRKVARALTDLQPAALRCSVVEIGDLPLYNEDLDGAPPAGWSRLRAELRRADAVLFVTPEYNRSIPGCLKNAIDVGSRPEKESVFHGLPAGVVSVTPYKLGAFGANHALRQTLVFLDMPVLQQPEVYVGGAAELFDHEGALKNEATRKLFASFMQAFGDWIATIDRDRKAGGHSFEDFMTRRATIAAAYVDGDAKPLDEILAREDPATFFSPRGDATIGAAAVSARYDADAATFSRGGSNRLEILQSAASGDVGWWTGYQIAEARLKGKDAPVPMKLRVTEAFRFRDGAWRLVHRHAEPTKPS